MLANTAFSQAVEITSEQSQLKLDPHLSYWSSFGPYPEPAFKAFRGGKFESEQNPISHGANHAPEAWFAFDLKNTSFDDGRLGDRLSLVLDGPTVAGFRLFLVRQDGLTETLVDYSIFQPFNAGDHIVNKIKSPEFIIAPGEQVTVLAHLQLGIVPAYSVSLFRPGALSQASFRWGVSMTAFYAFSLSCLLFGLGFQIAMRSWFGVCYVVMFLLFLANIAYVDGLFFRVLYPNRPSMHAPFGFGLLFSIAALGFAIVSKGFFEQIRKRSLLGMALGGLFLACLAAFIASIWLPAPWIAFLAYGMILASLFLNALLPNVFFKSESNPNVGIRAVVVLGIVVILALQVAMSFGSFVAGYAPGTLIKAAFLAMAMLTMTFLTGNLMTLRRRHLAAIEARVIALEAEAEKSRQLLNTERAYIRARETAAARQRQLATASHDIKQPLLSLRTTFDAITMDMDQAVRDRLQDAFIYLEELSKGYIDDTVPEIHEDAETDTADLEPEAYALSIPLGTVQQMFNAEAVSKGLRLKMVETSLMTTAPPIVLMRILTNLVSNSIKYTDAGGVLIGIRRRGSVIWVCDSGRGMDPSEIEDFQQAYRKGETSSGHGIGLSVCFELAAANDMPLTVMSVPGKGTVFAVSLAAYAYAS